MSRFLDVLRSGRVLLMDGAMGTELQRTGLRPGECGELWNLTHPEKVRAIHQAYVDAGAAVLLTNTFQANPAALAGHKLENQLGVICQVATDLARAAAGADRWVLADIGPYPFDDDMEALRRYTAALNAAEPDGFLIETYSDVDSIVRVLKAIGSRKLDSPPVLASFTYLRDRANRVQTIHGETPSQIASKADKYSLAAVGVNCGRDMGLPQILEVVEAYRANTSQPIFIRPNAGTPKQVDDRWVYPHSPEYMASWLPELLKAGVKMIGGCCGTTPAHIAALKPNIDKYNGA